MNLFFDTETTGLPANGFNWDTDYKKWPRIVTICWKLTGKEPKRFIVHQEGKKIPPEAIAIHGITDKMANNLETTEPLSFVLTEFMVDLEKAMNVVGHNVYFDTSMVKAETLRLWGPKSEQAKNMEELLHKDKRTDTMRSALQMLNNGQRVFKKWPKLTELYAHLFNGATFDAHNAMADVLACEKCFNELKKMKLV